MESINVTPTIFFIAISISLAQQHYADEEYGFIFIIVQPNLFIQNTIPKAVYGLKKAPEELETL